MTEGRDKCILELASTEEDVAVLNTKLVDFIVASEDFDICVVENMVANLLLICRNSSGSSLKTASISLATALFMIYNKSSSVCLVGNTKPVVGNIN